VVDLDAVVKEPNHFLEKLRFEEALVPFA